MTEHYPTHRPTKHERRYNPDVDADGIKVTKETEDFFSKETVDLTLQSRAAQIAVLLHRPDPRAFEKLYNEEKMADDEKEYKDNKHQAVKSRVGDRGTVKQEILTGRTFTVFQLAYLDTIKKSRILDGYLDIIPTSIYDSVGDGVDGVDCVVCPVGEGIDKAVGIKFCLASTVERAEREVARLENKVRREKLTPLNYFQTPKRVFQGKVQIPTVTVMVNEDEANKLLGIWSHGDVPTQTFLHRSLLSSVLLQISKQVIHLGDIALKKNKKSEVGQSYYSVAELLEEVMDKVDRATLAQGQDGKYAGAIKRYKEGLMNQKLAGKNPETVDEYLILSI